MALAQLLQRQPMTVDTEQVSPSMAPLSTTSSPPVLLLGEDRRHLPVTVFCVSPRSHEGSCLECSGDRTRTRALSVGQPAQRLDE